jgi:hypothetical protein
VSRWQTSWTQTSSGISISAVRTGLLLALGAVLLADVVLRLDPHFGEGGGVLSCLLLLPPSGDRRRRSTNHRSWQQLLHNLFPIITHTWSLFTP